MTKAKSAKSEKLESTERPSGEEVEISTLGVLQPFSYQGQVFTKRRVSADGVRALSEKGDELITLPPDTLVTPV